MFLGPRSGKVQGLRALEFIDLIVDLRPSSSSCYLPVVVLRGSSGYSKVLSVEHPVLLPLLSHRVWNVLYYLHLSTIVRGVTMTSTTMADQWALEEMNIFLENIQAFHASVLKQMRSHIAAGKNKMIIFQCDITRNSQQYR